MITLTQEESIVLEKIMMKHGIGEVLQELAYIFSFNNETHNLIFKEVQDTRQHKTMVNALYGTKGYTLTFRKGV